MSWPGIRGTMGSMGNENTIVMKMIDLWNKLGILDRYIYTDDERAMPQHLYKFNEAIESVRKHLMENPPPEDNTIKELEIKNPKFEIREGQSFLIGGDITFKNGMIIGVIDKENPHSIGVTGTKGVVA